jgi:hypothetical protein
VAKAAAAYSSAKEPGTTGDDQLILHVNAFVLGT